MTEPEKPCRGHGADEISALERDRDRLDWLADLDNDAGQVLLPRECVEQALTLRGAIDLAMARSGEWKTPSRRRPD